MLKRRKGLSRLDRGRRYVYVTEDLQAILDAAHRRSWRCVGDLIKPSFRRTMRFRCLPDWQRFALCCVQNPNGCWEWVASKKPSGYGQFYYRGTNWQAHRVAYELYVGQIPEGATIDHLCRNRSCVNPDHLEPVSGAENTARGLESRTHCPKGHELTLGTRARRAECRICKQANVRRQSDRQIAKKVAAGLVGSQAVLTDADVEEMRRLRAMGERVRDIAAMYGVTAKYASALISGRRTRRRRHTGPPPAIRRLVAERSRRSCEFPGCGAVAIQMHHRKPRRIGGRKDPEINRAANLLHVCLGHHEWVESNRADARAMGWLLSDGQDAQEVAVHTSHGWVLLDDNGGWEVLP